jgi:hydrogenase/urease accessory protein HupE
MPAGAYTGENIMKRALDAGLIAVLGAIPASAFAHGVHGAASSFGAGFAHPFSGLDHAFAMIAIGLYAARLKSTPGFRPRAGMTKEDTSWTARSPCRHSGQPQGDVIQNPGQVFTQSPPAGMTMMQRIASGAARLGSHAGTLACAALVAGAMFGTMVAAEPLFEALVMVSVCALGLLLLGERVVATGWAAACIAVFGFAHGAIHAIEQPVEFSSAGYVGGVLLASVALQAAGATIGRLLDHRARLAGVPLAAAGAWILLASMA